MWAQEKYCQYESSVVDHYTIQILLSRPVKSRSRCGSIMKTMNVSQTFHGKIIIFTHLFTHLFLSTRSK